MSVRIDADALEGMIEYVRLMPEKTRKAASLAINQVTQREGMKAIRDEILDQLAFPKDYLTGDRLRITRFSTPETLESVIAARMRPTSLARFASGQPIGRPGITVTVQNGQSVRLKRAWLVRLRKGASLTADNYNVGLAVRVKEGDTILNKNSAHQAWLVKDKVALLYGPSVDQAFANVADQLARPLADMVANEFNRQFERLK